MLYLTHCNQIKYDYDFGTELIEHFVMNKTGRVVLENIFRLAVGRSHTNRLAKILREDPELTTKNLEYFDFKFITELFLSKATSNSRIANNATIYYSMLSKKPEVFNTSIFLSEFSKSKTQILDLALSNERYFKNLILMCVNDIKENYNVIDEENIDKKKYVSLTMILNCFSISQRLTQNGYLFNEVIELLSLLYIQYRNNGKQLNLELESNTCEYLIQHDGKVPLSFIEEIYSKVKGKKFFPHQDRFFTHIINNKQGALENEELMEEAKQKIEEYEYKLTNIDSKVVLNSLAFLMAQDMVLIKDNFESYLNTLKEHLSFGNAVIYMELVDALPIDKIKKNVDIYVPFIRELADYYSNFSKRLKTLEILRCLEKFSKIRFTRPSLYNAILNDVGRNFNNFRMEDHSRVLGGFTKLGLKQTDLFDKITLKISNNFDNSIPFLGKLVSDFFRVNYDSNLYREHITDLCRRARFSIFNSLVLVRTVISLEMENEAEILEKLFEGIDIERGFKTQNYLLNESLYTVHLILKNEYPDKDWAEKIKQSMKDYDSWTNDNSFLSQGSKSKDSLDELTKYLDVMKVGYELDKEVDGVKVPIYIPSQKTLVGLLPRVGLNFDKFTFNGRTV